MSGMMKRERLLLKNGQSHKILYSHNTSRPSQWRL